LKRERDPNVKRQLKAKMDEVDKNGDHHQSRDQESQIHLMVIPVQTNTSLRISTKEIYLESP
jgi:hypothetical protein